MKALRIIASSLSVVVLTIILFVMAIIWGVASILSSSAPMKQAMAENNLYSAVVQDAIRESDTALKELTRINKDYRDEVVTVLTPYSEQSLNKGFDGLFVWLGGGSDDFTFTTDFTPARQEVIEITSNYNFKPELAQKLQSDAVWTKLASEFESAVGGSDDAKSQFEPIKPFYPLMMALVWVLPLLALGLVALIIWLAPALRNGLRRSGIVLMIAGVLAIALNIFGTWAFGNVSISPFSTAGRTAFLKTMVDLGSSALGVILWAGIIMTLIGLAALIMPVFMKKSSSGDEKQNPTG
jgi:hypothetical protein